MKIPAISQYLHELKQDREMYLNMRNHFAAWRIYLEIEGIEGRKA
jgi:LPS sulfotransferase NodH